MFPEADLGLYRCNDFECKVCGDVISGVSETVWKHINKHNFDDIHQYNHTFNVKQCENLCGKASAYSYARSEYLRFCDECHTRNMFLEPDNHPGYKSLLKSKLSIDKKIKQENINKNRYINNKQIKIENNKKYSDRRNILIRKRYDDINDNFKERILNWQKYNYKNNIHYKIKINCSSRILKALKQNKKINVTINLIGCSIKELKIHLESKFLPTMTWENHGTLWEIDHCIPCAAFNLEYPAHQMLCFNWRNLQPLFSITTIINEIEYLGNRNKSDKIIYE